MEPRLRERFIHTYTDLTAYWMAPRVIAASQTVDFIAAQAAHCAALLAHHATAQATENN